MCSEEARACSALQSGPCKRSSKVRSIGSFPSVRWPLLARPPWRRETLIANDDFQFPADTVDFAHQSEEQFARLLDFYGIDWEYEPRSFAISFNGSGEATSYFTPDFYLPDENLYIEITTMNQKLVTKKNRKIKRLRQLYPAIQCKIFYQRDYLHLLVKYGLEAENATQVAAPTRIPGPPRVKNLGEVETG